MNTEEPPPSRITTVEKFLKGVSKTSKPFGLTFVPDTAQRRVVSVCKQEWKPKGRQKKGAAVAYDWRIVKVFATFEGPTADKSAAEYIELMKTRTPANGTKCVADGLSLKKLTINCHEHRPN